MRPPRRRPQAVTSSAHGRAPQRLPRPWTGAPPKSPHHAETATDPKSKDPWPFVGGDTPPGPDPKEELTETTRKQVIGHVDPTGQWLPPAGPRQIAAGAAVP